MTTLRKRITRPYTQIFIIMPILIILLFNVLSFFFVQSRAQEELNEVSQTIHDVLNEKREISDDTEALNNALKSIMGTFNNPVSSESVQLLLLDENGEVSRIFNANFEFDEDLALDLYEEVLTLDKDEIGSVDFEGEFYYVIEIDYGWDLQGLKLVYLSQGPDIELLSIIMNTILGIVFFLTSFCSMMILRKTTNAVAEPIEKLTSLVLNMKSDELIFLEDKSNILEINKLTEEINELNKRAYHYDKAQKNFLSNASHEIRTPLMSIQGYADGIEMGVFEDYKETAGLISKQCQKLTKLVNSLLTLAKTLDFDNHKDLEKLNISDNLYDVISIYNGYALNENKQIITDIESNIYTMNSEELLQEAIGNIISNAIRYCAQNITVSLKTKGDKAIIIIADDGRGLEETEKIFEKFHKGEDGNYGLGLSIAKTAVKMMNGEIKAYNDNGAVFEIRLNVI